MTNPDIIRQMLDRAAEEPHALYDVLAEDVEWDATGLTLDTGGRRGREAVMEFFRSWVGPFADWNYEVEELVDCGASVVVRIHQWGRGKGSGAPVEDRFWQVWTLRDGKVVRTTHHRDRDDALAAAGATAS